MKEKKVLRELKKHHQWRVRSLASVMLTYDIELKDAEAAIKIIKTEVEKHAE